MRSDAAKAERNAMIRDKEDSEDFPQSTGVV